MMVKEIQDVEHIRSVLMRPDTVRQLTRYGRSSMKVDEALACHGNVYIAVKDGVVDHGLIIFSAVHHGFMAIHLVLRGLKLAQYVTAITHALRVMEARGVTNFIAAFAAKRRALVWVAQTLGWKLMEAAMARTIFEPDISVPVAYYYLTLPSPCHS